MRVIAAIGKWLAIVIVVLLAGVATWLYVAPPAPLRVATGYAAKIVCSNTYLANRDPREVLAVDVQAPGHPLLRYVDISVDRRDGTVEAGLFGLFGGGMAVVRPGTGCAAVPDGDLSAARGFNAPVPPGARSRGLLWPGGDGVERNAEPAIAGLLDDMDLTGPGMRAVVVVHDGRIVGERYGHGFSETTPLLGWSMTKTVTAALVGRLIEEGRLPRDADGLFTRWSDDEREAIGIDDMLAMTSGLAFNEDYGDVTDVTRMLYLEPDMADFAAGRPLAGEVGETFSYSSGTSVMLSRIWQDTYDDQSDALAWPRESLFAPLGMDSALVEADARGTFVGSSYMYATARDWARFGQFLLHEGRWDGAQLLPEGYVDWMRAPTEASNGAYGRHVWLHGPTAGTPQGEDPDAGFDLPGDAFWLLGHDGQSVAVIPSRDLVVVRMGLSPDRLGYKPQALVEAVAGAL